MLPQEILKKYPQKNFTISNNLTLFEIAKENLCFICEDLYFKQNFSLKLITALDRRAENGFFEIIYLFENPQKKYFLSPFLRLKDGETFPSLSHTIHEASMYERKILSMFGLKAEGHPNLRGAILHENWPAGLYPLRKDFDWQTRPKEAQGNYEFYQVEGEGIYEIPVGPIHAGIIEPGHFRFSVAGEEIVLLEAKLGYKHRGVEKLFETLPLEKKIKLAEKISADSSFTYSLAFCEALEQLAKISVPKTHQFLRVIFSELERIANHFNDIGFMMTDTGFSFGGSQCARLRETIMQWNEHLSGSRFLKNLNVIGGVSKNIEKNNQEKLLEFLADLEKDFSQVIEISDESAILLNRFKGTGKINSKLARDHGVIGVAARALCLAKDTRLNNPYAAYGELKLKIAQEPDGDVYARYWVRVKEVYSSISLIKQALAKLENFEFNPIAKTQINFAKNSYTISLVEAWRGEALFFIATDKNGQIERVDFRDPSFLNWQVLGHAGRGNVVPDFPLINKSFNLAYAGNDL